MTVLDAQPAPHAELTFPDRAARRAPSSPRSAEGARARSRNKLENAARLLEKSEDFRILRRLEPTGIDDDWSNDHGTTKLGIVLDTETTGLDHRREEIVEIAMLAFRYDAEGIRSVVGSYEGLQQPTRPLAPELESLTGITNGMLEGKRIDPLSVEAFVRPASLIVAHNAKFDRPFCQTWWPVFRTKAWACSMSEIAWRDFGIEARTLSGILQSCGFFHSAHRAMDDCHALLKILRAPLGPDRRGAFAALLSTSGRTTVEISAEGAPFAAKDVLKARGYRWSDGSDGRRKAWRLVLSEEAAPDEVRFLETRVYPSGGPVVRTLEADRRHAGD